MDTATRRLVRSRARWLCEYCHARQADEPFVAFQIEHVIAKQHDGTDEDTNLAQACSQCNLHKGPNVAGFDPLDSSLTKLFHPRLQQWDDHFAVRGPLIVGITAVGRTTVRVLGMNDRVRIERRIALAQLTILEGGDQGQV